jgi:alpha-L-rhamnosidase
LQQIDRNDLLYTIFNQESYPGWGYMLSQGATTFWEQWNGHYSHIHSCFTSPGGWFYQGLGGINPDPSVPGFKKIIIKPSFVGDLNWVKTSYNSNHGEIVSNWSREGETLTMEVVIPPNTTATVYVPATKIEDVTESGNLDKVKISEVEGITFKQMENGKAVFEVASGSYTFLSRRK